MKSNSKVSVLLSALFVLAIMISSVGAADLANGGIKSGNFAIDLPEGSDFVKEATTNLNVGDLSISMEVFENKGNNANDVSAVMYFKDSSSKKELISELYGDLKKDGAIVEENDKYFAVETKNANNWNFFNFDIADDLEDLWDFATGLFSSDSGVSVSTEEGDVNVSNGGINILSGDNSTVSLSSEGIKVSDGDGGDVSISTDGIKVTDSEDLDDFSSGDVNISIDEGIISEIESSDYALCIKNPNNGQAIIITGNNLDMMKKIAESASFSEE